MSEVIEERHLSGKRREVKRYSDLLKSQLIKDRPNGVVYRFNIGTLIKIPEYLLTVKRMIGKLCDGNSIIRVR